MARSPKKGKRRSEVPGRSVVDRAVRRVQPGSPEIKRWQHFGAIVAVLGGVLGASAVGLRLLGLLVHRAREAMIGIEQLHYPEHELVLTGLGVLLHLPWRAVSALFSSHEALRASAWSLAVLSALVLWGAGKLRRRYPVVLLGVASIMAVVLFVGISIGTIAVRARNLERQTGTERAFCTNTLSPNLADRVAYESCSWLTNEGARNDERRESLGGLAAWLMLGIICAGVAVYRADVRSRRRFWRRWRAGFGLGLFGLGMLLVFRLLPLAHAYANWGLRYPQVTILAVEGCRLPDVLEEAHAADLCCAYDVTDVATSKLRMLRLVGSGCPDSHDGALRVSDGCAVIRSGGPRLMNQGCG